MRTNWSGVHQSANTRKDSKRGEVRTIKKWERGGKHTYRRRQRGSLQRDIRRRERRADYSSVLVTTLCSLMRMVASPLWCDTQKNKHYIHRTEHINGTHWHVRLIGVCLAPHEHPSFWKTHDKRIWKNELRNMKLNCYHHPLCQFSHCDYED